MHPSVRPIPQRNEVMVKLSRSVSALLVAAAASLAPAAAWAGWTNGACGSTAPFDTMGTWGSGTTCYSLMTAGASGFVTGINTAEYTQGTAHGTGSGTFVAFSRVKGQGDGTQEQGYNSTANVLNNDNTNTFNHAIKIGDVGFKDGGMVFNLDINEQNNATGRFLNLDDIQIFISTKADQAVTTFTSGILNLTDAQLVYRMDIAGTANALSTGTKPLVGKPPGDALDNTVVMDYSLGAGQGQSDMTLFVPQSFFYDALDLLFPGGWTSSMGNNTFVYLYSAFGSNPNNADANYEEWSYQKGLGTPIPPNEVPAPAPLALLAVSAVAAGLVRRRTSKPAQRAEHALA